jgi:hypothetical protein
VYPCIDANIDAKWGSNQWVDGGFPVVGDEPVYLDRAAFNKGVNAQYEPQITRTAAEEDGTGRGNPIIPVAVGFNWQNGGGYGKANDGLGITEEGTGPLQRCNTPAVAFTQNQREEVRDLGEVATACSAEPGMHQQTYLAIPFDTTQVTSPLNYSNPKSGDPCHPLAATAHVPAVAVDTYNQTVGDTSIPVRVGNAKDSLPAVMVPTVAFKESQSGCRCGEVHATIDANKESRRQEGVLGGMQVRRLTPTECCRLQGFPDDHCDITFRKKPAADGPKYRALGNSMAVPCMAWLGYRIDKATRQDT